jgi:hypothetical protein
MVVTGVFGADGNIVSASFNLDPGFVQPLLRASILDRTDFNLILVPGRDVYGAVDIVELDSASGSKRISLVKLLGVTSLIRRMSLSDGEQ